MLMTVTKTHLFIAAFFIWVGLSPAFADESFPSLDGPPPQTFHDLWQGYDPTA